LLRRRSFPGSGEYWVKRYESGGDSGAGSCRKLAQFKAEVLNNFVREKNIATVIEFGCGDGTQLGLSEYPSYLGFDVSPKAIALCEGKFAGDECKTFRPMDGFRGERAQLTLSLDVIYHLTEDDVFNGYMSTLFDSADEFVIIYSSDSDLNEAKQPPHVRHRRFSRWIEENRPQFKLLRHVPNRYPITLGKDDSSFADFRIYERGDSRWSGRYGSSTGQK